MRPSMNVDQSSFWKFGSWRTQTGLAPRLTIRRNRRCNVRGDALVYLTFMLRDA